MQVIPSEPSHPTLLSLRDERAFDSVGGLIACIGEADFAQDALAQLNRWMPVAWWSIYRLLNDAPPTLHANASFGVPDGTLESWRAYRGGLYERDETFSEAREQARNSNRLLVHWHAREIPRRHRERIYSKHGLRERLSIVCRDKEEAILAVNLYRHEEQTPFTDEEIDALGSAAGLLLSCVQKHLSISGARSASSAAFDVLTPRELDVCQRMLKGWTYDGIAADLRISAGTVKTYRDRAFDRLGINHRNQLFALMAGQRG